MSELRRYSKPAQFAFCALLVLGMIVYAPLFFFRKTFEKCHWL
jgi:hypothetical protein